MKLKDIVAFEPKIITPQAGKMYHLYSLPSFDDGYFYEILDGKNIQSNKYIVPDKCILFNKLNVRFKRVLRIEDPDTNKICSTEYLPLVVNESKVDYQYCYYLLISDKITNYLCGQNTNTSGSHKRINPNNFLDIDIVLPELAEQKRIGKLLSDIDHKIELNRALNQNLPTLDRSSEVAVVRLVA
jgi:restriction endonuclease S subunit